MRAEGHGEYEFLANGGEDECFFERMSAEEARKILDEWAAQMPRA